MRGLMVCLVLFFLVPVSFGQSYSLDTLPVNQFTFINWDKNKLKFPGDSSRFIKLFSRMDSMLIGKEDFLHFFHIGGSHIQADIYSDQIRNYLQHLGPGFQGPRGFVFPYKMAQTNNPKNYTVDYTGKWSGVRCSMFKETLPWGLAGISASTRDSSNTFSFSCPSEYQHPYDFNGVRLYYNTWNKNYQIRPCDPDIIVNEEQNAEAGYIEYALSQPSKEVMFEVYRIGNEDRSEPFILMGADLQGEEKGIEYTSIGVNGAGFEAYKRCEYFESQLGLYHPDVFIVSIGTNDAYTSYFDTLKFERNYQSFIEMVYRNNPDCALILTVPNDSYYQRKYANKNTRLVRSVIYRLAEKYDAAVWDFYEIMGGLGSSMKWYKSGLMPYDRIHFTKEGYLIKGNLFIRAFLTQWAKMTGKDEEVLFTCRPQSP